MYVRRLEIVRLFERAKQGTRLEQSSDCSTKDKLCVLGVTEGQFGVVRRNVFHKNTCVIVLSNNSKKYQLNTYMLCKNSQNQALGNEYDELTLAI